MFEVFSQLEQLAVGEILPETILSLGTLVVETANDPIQAYTFVSTAYSHPHLIHVQAGKIVYIQLSVPANEQERFTRQLKGLGEPEVTLHTSDIEYLVSFPSQGTAFITNGEAEQVLRIMKFLPKTAKEFVTVGEGKNFRPVPQTPELPTITPSVTATSSASPSFILSNQEIGLILLASAFIVVAIFLWKKNFHPSG